MDKRWCPESEYAVDTPIPPRVDRNYLERARKETNRLIEQSIEEYAQRIKKEVNERIRCTDSSR